MHRWETQNINVVNSSTFRQIRFVRADDEKQDSTVKYRPLDRILDTVVTQTQKLLYRLS